MKGSSDSMIFFMDESQKTDVFRIRDGKPTFDTPDNLDSFIGLFCGYHTEEVDQDRNLFILFESKWKLKYSIPLDQEFKSTVIKKKHFEYGFASLKGNSKLFYHDFLELLVRINPVISISFSNKIEILLRKTISNIKLENKRKNNFFYILSKFFSLYGDGGFFDKVIKYPEEAIFELSERLKQIAKHDASVPRLEKRNDAF